MTTEEQQPTQTILVIEDEESIMRTVKIFLQQAGFRVLSAADGSQGIEMHTREHPDLVLLDIMLPKVDGREVMREIRSWSNTPIVMMTALRAESEKIEGLDHGADDYITKPFSPRELVSRVRAVLRRTTPKPTVTEEILRYKDLVIHPSTHRVEAEGKPVELTAKEFQLLLTLASAHDQIFTREALLRRVWGFEYLGDSRTVDVHVGTLRRKIEQDPTNPRFIKTLWRVGYKFDPHGIADEESKT